MPCHQDTVGTHQEHSPARGSTVQTSLSPLPPTEGYGRNFFSGSLKPHDRFSEDKCNSSTATVDSPQSTPTEGSSNATSLCLLGLKQSVTQLRACPRPPNLVEVKGSSCVQHTYAAGGEERLRTPISLPPGRKHGSGRGLKSQAHSCASPDMGTTQRQRSPRAETGALTLLVPRVSCSLCSAGHRDLAALASRCQAEVTGVTPESQQGALPWAPAAVSAPTTLSSKATFSPRCLHYRPAQVSE